MPPAFHGAGLSLQARTYGPDQELAWHIHERACLCMVLAGEVLEVDRRGERLCAPADVVYKPGSTPHRNRIGTGGARILSLELDAGRAAGLQEAGIPLGEPRQVRSGTAAALATRIWRELASPGPAAPLLAEGLALELLAEWTLAWLPAPDGSPPWLERARRRLADAPHRPHTLEELATEAGVHPMHLARVFRRSFGESVGEHLRRLRVERAARRLAETDLPLAEVALDSGFYDQSHLTRAFKRRTGTTPGAYRRSLARRRGGRRGRATDGS